jgi:DNA-directed RNA polymerase omega subunit
MLKPSLDELVKKTHNNRYLLCIMASKRANKLEDLETIKPLVEHLSSSQSLGIALQEIAEGKIVLSEEN